MPATAKLRNVWVFFELLVEHTQLYVNGTEGPINVVEFVCGTAVAFIHQAILDGIQKFAYGLRADFRRFGSPFF